MKEFRITKYDPANRDSSGAYLISKEWTSFSEVGTNVTREAYWCRLESDIPFIHVGWDYYMYLGVSEVPEISTVEKIQNRKLFIENFKSPYHTEECELVHPTAGDVLFNSGFLTRR